MKCDFSFKHLDTSSSLMTYTNERLGEIEKYLLKAGRANVEFSRNKKHDFQVEVTIQSGIGYFKATSHGDSFQSAVDAACEKLSKQFLKNRKIQQKHKSWDRSKRVRTDKMHDVLEYNYEQLEQFNTKKVA